MRKPAFCICETKGADQHRLCLRYTDSTIHLLPKSEISSLSPYSEAVQPGLCQARSETRMLVFSCRGSVGSRRRVMTTQNKRFLENSCNLGGSELRVTLLALNHTLSV